ncbi:hypothetical protein [Paenibacillus paeoniae]|uniref:hypothetical protein n=1 Tax=Paenibacillus paeoniae TaxID=2292705 RepID=UPI0014028799|nr:hypothetical protein [Paenibacillus paeoniae]
MEFKSTKLGNRGNDPANERKSLVEKRMEMIAHLLMKRSEGGIKRTPIKDETIRHS